MGTREVYNGVTSGDWSYIVYFSCWTWAQRGARSAAIDYHSREDVCSEVIRLLFEKPPRLETPSSFPAYVAKMAHRLAVQRSKKRVVERDALEAMPSERVSQGPNPIDLDAEGILSRTRAAVGAWVAVDPRNRIELLEELSKLGEIDDAQIVMLEIHRQQLRALLNGLRGTVSLGQKPWRNEAKAQVRQVREIMRRLGVLSSSSRRTLLLHRRAEPRWPVGGRGVMLRWGDACTLVDVVDWSERGLGVRISSAARTPEGKVEVVLGLTRVSGVVVHLTSTPRQGRVGLRLLASESRLDFGGSTPVLPT